MNLQENIQRIKQVMGVKDNTPLNEQRALGKLIGNSIDDFIRLYGDDAAMAIDRALAKLTSNPANVKVNMNAVRAVMDDVAKGKAGHEIIDYLPKNTADATNLRQTVIGVLNSKKVVPNAAHSLLHPYQKKFIIPGRNSVKDCPNIESIINNLFGKLSNIAKYHTFNPSKVKVLSRAPDVYGREIIEVALEDGTNVLFYKSSGQNTATTGKKSGEWFVLPGFSADGHFTKTKKSIALTKGTNKYLTDMAKFLEMYGSSALGKK